jgi:hypothetical protein
MPAAPTDTPTDTPAGTAPNAADSAEPDERKQRAAQRSKLAAAINAVGPETAGYIAGINNGINSQSNVMFTKDQLHHTARALLAAGCPVSALEHILNAHELPTIAVYAQRGITHAVLWQVADRNDLRHLQHAINAGAGNDVLGRIAASDHLGLEQYALLRGHGMPDQMLTRILDGNAVPARQLERAIDTGITWDDITWMLDTTNRFDNVVALLEDPADKDRRARLEQIPTRILALAAVLADDSAVDLIDTLPAASALAGQPWEQTATALIRDRAVADGEAHIAGQILAARALDNDPTLPPSRPRPARTAPPALTGIARVNPDQPLATALEAAGVPHAEAVTAAAWIGPHAETLHAGAIPEHTPYSHRVIDVIAAALARGTTVTDIRLTSAVIAGRHGVGVENAALIHACGVTRDTAEQWAREGADPTTTTLLVAHGMNPEQAAAYSRDHGTDAWHVIDLLSSGNTPSDAIAAVTPIRRRAAGHTWHVVRGDTQPVPTGVLLALADAGLDLDQVGEDQYAGPDDTHALPEGVTSLALAADLLLAAPSTRARDGDGASTVAIAYAAAAAGQPWLAASPLTAISTQNGVDPRVTIAQHTLTARGISARGVDQAEPAPTRTARVCRPAPPVTGGEPGLLR